MNESVGSVIVSWDFSRGDDNDILLVGKQQGGAMTVINAFQGREAHIVHEKLITIKKKEETTNE